MLQDQHSGVARGHSTFLSEKNSASGFEAQTPNDGEDPGGRDEVAPPGPLRPSLSTERQLNRKVGGDGWKSALKLGRNAERFVEEKGIENCGFLTLTFADQTSCMKEAQRRFNSLATHVLNERYDSWVVVKERHESMAIHYHLLVDLGWDARTGFDFAALQAMPWQTLKNMPPSLRATFWRGLCPSGSKLPAEWAFWRKASRSYGFGRHELLPVKSTAEGVAWYMGKYLGKHMDHRVPQDKGARLVRYSKRAPRTMYGDFAGIGGVSWLWCVKVPIWLGHHFDRKPRWEGVSARMGRHWAFKYRAEIMASDLVAAKVKYLDDYTCMLDHLCFRRGDKTGWIHRRPHPEKPLDAKVWARAVEVSKMISPELDKLAYEMTEGAEYRMACVAFCRKRENPF